MTFIIRHVPPISVLLQGTMVYLHIINVLNIYRSTNMSQDSRMRGFNELLREIAKRSFWFASLCWFSISKWLNCSLGKELGTIVFLHLEIQPYCKILSHLFWMQRFFDQDMRNFSTQTTYTHGIMESKLARLTSILACFHPLFTSSYQMWQHHHRRNETLPE